MYTLGTFALSVAPSLWMFSLSVWLLMPGVPGHVAFTASLCRSLSQGTCDYWWYVYLKLCAGLITAGSWGSLVGLVNHLINSGYGLPEAPLLLPSQERREVPQAPEASTPEQPLSHKGCALWKSPLSPGDEFSVMRPLMGRAWSQSHSRLWGQD